MKPLVIYHADCTDGLWRCVRSTGLKLGDEAEYMPMNYKLMHQRTGEDRKFLCADFSFDRERWMPTRLTQLLASSGTRPSQTVFEMWCANHILKKQRSS